MWTKNLIYLTTFLVILEFQNASAGQLPEPKKFLPSPVDIAKYQIKKLIELVQSVVETQIKILDSIREFISTVVETSIRTASDAIDAVIDNSIGTARKIIQYAVDRGINVTECTVINMDKLHRLRRQLIIGEISCATSQAGEFNKIIDDAVQNFTDDLAVVLEFPKRLQKCLVTITAVKCVTELIEDVTQLQKDIPAQIWGTMQSVAEYMTGFETRVHKCQFDQLRKAVDGTRVIIDELILCVRDRETNSEA